MTKCVFNLIKFITGKLIMMYVGALYGKSYIIFAKFLQVEKLCDNRTYITHKRFIPYIIYDIANSISLISAARNRHNTGSAFNNWRTKSKMLCIYIQQKSFIYTLSLYMCVFLLTFFFFSFLDFRILFICVKSSTTDWQELILILNGKSAL